MKFEVEKRVIYVYDGEYSVYVSNKSTLDRLSSDGGATYRSRECENIAKKIAYYVDDNLFDSMCDDDIATLVNAELYHYVR